MIYYSFSVEVLEMSKVPNTRKHDFEGLLVDGYIRYIQKQINRVIPASILAMCLDYHGTMDYFPIIGQQIKVQLKGKIKMQIETSCNK